MAVTHYSPGQGKHKTACGINVHNVPYFSFDWRDINCKRCLNTVPACHTMFRNKKGARKSEARRA